MQAIEHDFRTGASTDEPARPAREGLLACFQHFLGHDLPNRLVGVQGLPRVILADTDLAPSAQTRPLLQRLADLIRQADDGLGLSPKQLALLAELWNQGHADHASLGPGWLLVRHLVAACGGAIRVCSAPEEGTIVSLTLRVPPIFRGPLQ